MIEALAPCILGGDDADRPYPWAKPQRRLDCWLLVAIRRGTEQLSVPGTTRMLDAGTAYLIPPGMPHVLASPRGSWPLWLHVRLAGPLAEGPVTPLLPDRARPSDYDLAGWPWQGPPLPLPTAAAAMAKAILPRLIDAWRSGDRCARASAALEAAQLILAIGRRADQGGERLSAVETALRQSLAAPPSLAAMARIAGLSRSRFCALWAQRHDAPPATWLRRERQRMAEALLLDTRLALAEIAARCGWQDVPAFVRAFRRAVGQPPGRWRRDHAEPR